MAEHSKAPEEMQFAGDIASQWKLWKQKFELYPLASGKSNKTDEVKIAILLNLLGDEGLHIYNTFEYNEDEDQMKLNIVLKKFHEYCNPVKNTVENSVTTQKEISKNKEQNTSVYAVNRYTTNYTNKTKYSPLHKVEQQYTRQNDGGNPSTSRNNMNVRGNRCKNCGYIHDVDKCSAVNRYCTNCKQRGHYRKFCRSKLVHNVAKNEQFEECGENEENRDESEEYHIVWTINDSCVNSIEWYELLLVNNVQINLKIDTGSQVNILNHSDFKKLGISESELLQTKSTLSSYSGHKIDIRGKISIHCSINEHTSNLLFYILQSDSACSILGLQAASELQIIDANKMQKGLNKTIYNVENHLSVPEILNKHKRVFKGIGKVNKTYKITLRQDAVPHISAARKIPLALKDQVKKKLDEMVSEKIIVPVTEPTDWVHPLVIAPKSNGDIRLCMDPRSLNVYIKRENFQIPTIDCRFSELRGARYFTLLDASQAFLQIPLDFESSKLCTVATSWGRFRYLRLPFGISSAPEIFQRFIYDALEGLRGVIAYIDDILVIVPEILNKHKRVFKGIGKVNKTYKITLRQDAVPHISAARKIPLALKDQVKKKLDEMVSEKIIVPVTEPTDWVHPLVIAPKSNGDIRLCMDPRSLNVYIKRFK
ncbi:uncharacterized protein K02A2.6-like [Anoplophora glabripennis]|uniref:uncharacterized protein K02A2.6-like n=1 Tax=Anoplophora glabripennis TaxID=217634 RepID=UPI000C75F494|nr:uncharacterized protein K02A2.6-like [Anoplophora glabripennis]